MIACPTLFRRHATAAINTRSSTVGTMMVVNETPAPFESLRVGSGVVVMIVSVVTGVLALVIAVVVEAVDVHAKPHMNGHCALV